MNIRETIESMNIPKGYIIGVSISDFLDAIDLYKPIRLEDIKGWKGVVISTDTGEHPIIQIDDVGDGKPWLITEGFIKMFYDITQMMKHEQAR